MDRKPASGRPPKYDEPSRPVTVTLPDSVLEGLRSIHADRGQAIVKLTEMALRQDAGAPPAVEVIKVAAGFGLIVVGPTSLLSKIPFLHLVEVSPQRFILALERGHDFRSLELAISDLISDSPGIPEREQDLLNRLVEEIRKLRKNAKVSMAEILLVSLDAKR
jgi:hypothetical protein